MVTAQPQITTAEQLLQAGDIGRCCLVRGELIMMSPSGFEHGRIVVRISTPLATFVQQKSLGVVTGAETGFFIDRNPDTVRAPDVGFVTAERVGESTTIGFFPGAPDLAVEVVSPSDNAGEVLAKVHDWLDAGCRAVWIVDPKKQSVSAYRSRDDVVVWTVTDELADDILLPGFVLPVGEIFAT